MKRMKPKVRHDQILATALEMARQGHHLKINRNDLAKRLGVVGPLINLYFPTKKALQDAVYFEAINKGVIEVIAQRIPPEGRLSAETKRKLKRYLKEKLQ